MPPLTPSSLLALHASAVFLKIRTLFITITTTTTKTFITSTTSLRFLLRLLLSNSEVNSSSRLRYHDASFSAPASRSLLTAASCWLDSSRHYDQTVCQLLKHFNHYQHYWNNILQHNLKIIPKLVATFRSPTACFIRLVVTWCWAHDQKTVIGCRKVVCPSISVHAVGFFPDPDRCDHKLTTSRDHRPDEACHWQAKAKRRN